MKVLNYAMQCKDVTTGKVGTFAFDSDEYLNADTAMQFKAKSPVFDSFYDLCAWAAANRVTLSHESLTWRKK